MDNIKDSIKTEGEKIGIDVIGFAPCSTLTQMKEILSSRESMGYLSGFEESDIEKRINPSLQLNGCRTIISAGVSYYQDGKYAKQKEDYIHKCIVSRSSWGLDYHNMLKSKLNSLAEFMAEKYGADTKVFVDTGPLPEREIARLAGVGFVGKNGFIINREYGSFIFIGEILTDIYIEPDKPVEDGCGDCDICIRSCPSGALLKPYTLNAKRCISYLTQCKSVNPEFYRVMGSNIYGCDICQAACPKNRKIKSTIHDEFVPECWNCFPDAVDILNMDNKTYKETFKNTSSGWRGRKVLQRNAIISLGNSRKKEAAGYIVKMLSDSRSDIRETSIFALYNLLGKECIPVLKEYMDKESDEHIRNTIAKIMNGEYAYLINA